MRWSNRGYPDCDFEDDWVAFVHHCTVAGRWLCAICCILAIGIPSVWFLRDEIALWQSFFSWAAVRYALLAHPWPAFGLSLCFSLTISTLVWQSRNILWGLSEAELEYRHRIAHLLRERGKRSTLWIWFQYHCEQTPR